MYDIYQNKELFLQAVIQLNPKSGFDVVVIDTEFLKKVVTVNMPTKLDAVIYARNSVR